MSFLSCLIARRVGMQIQDANLDLTERSVQELQGHHLSRDII